jgi:hypothetical protein
VGHAYLPVPPASPNLNSGDNADVITHQETKGFSQNHAPKGDSDQIPRALRVDATTLRNDATNQWSPINGHQSMATNQWPPINGHQSMATNNRNHLATQGSD